MQAESTGERFVGLLLAAGHARRFGTDKLLYPLADGTPVAVAAARALRAACPDSMAVLRPDQTALAGRLSAEGLRIVTSPESTLGMGHSLAAGVRACADEAGWIIALGDMPFIAPATVRRVVSVLAEATRAGDASAIVAPTIDGIRGHPVGFASHWRTLLSELGGDTGAGHILMAHSQHLIQCAVDDKGVILDVDTPGDVIVGNSGFGLG